MRGDAVIYLWDDADIAGALGYHDRNHHGIPYGFVFTEIAQSVGEAWTVTLSHAVLCLPPNGWRSKAKPREPGGRFATNALRQGGEPGSLGEHASENPPECMSIKPGGGCQGQGEEVVLAAP
jgi:hypothetical protein